MNRAVAVGLLVASALPALPASAGAQGRGYQLTLDASVLRGTLGYARRVSPAAHVGMEAGLGVPLLDVTLTETDRLPGGDTYGDLHEYVHAAVFLRHRLGQRISYDSGIRGSIVFTRDCGDFCPDAFIGGYFQPMFGGRRWSVGPRIIAGWVVPSVGPYETRFAVSLAPLNVRLRLL